jgi:SAM-dependent methyltransferase
VRIDAADAFSAPWDYMNSWFYQRKTCRLCDSSTVKCVVPLEPIPIVTPNVDAKTTAQQYAGLQAQLVPLGLYLCEACGHLQLVDVINPGVQYDNFTYTTSISLGLPEHFRTFAGEVATDAGIVPGALVVEIGSNDGTLLRAFQERGFRVLGIDPAQKIAARASELGVTTLAEFFTEELATKIRAEHGAADVVVANNTFANLDDLGDFAAAIRKLLAPSGLFVFETSYGADVVRKTLVDTVYHEHLSYFMVGPLERYFARHGLQLIDVKHIWTKGGSIRGFVQLADGPRRRATTVADLIGQEKHDRLDTGEPYEKMKGALSRLRSELGELVSQRRKAGSRLAGYGASVGSVTLLHLFGLRHVLEFIADDKPLCEQISGGDYRIPVVPSAEIYERNPASIIILAWRYADPILAKHARYLAQGGEFIIPLPTISIRSATSLAKSRS